MKANNRFLAKPEQTPANPIRGSQQLPEISVTSFTAGMNTEDDSADIKDDELVLAKNFAVSDGKLKKMSGLSLITPTKPDSDPVKKFVSLKLFDASVIQLRFTDTKIYQRGDSAWAEIPNGGTSPLTQAPNNIVSTDNRHFISTDGSTVIQEIDVAAGEYLELGNAPRYRYITSFDNRLFGAHLLSMSGNIPIQIGWTGTFDFDEWDPNVNFEAGFTPLEESQSDYADFITGLFGFASQLLIMRERSVWLANKTGNVTAPFFFYTAAPYVGCDTPGSIQKIPNGVVWYDRRTNGVYLYEIGGGPPSSIGRKIENDILDSIGNPDTVTSSFDPVHLEYRLVVPLVGTTTTRIWTYSFRSNTWSIEERDSISCVSNLDYAEATGTIQDLVGNIEDLIGPINELGGVSVPFSTNFYGMQDGDINQEDFTIDTGYTAEIVSKTWVAPSYGNMYVRRLLFTYEVVAGGTFDIYISKDDGITYTLWKSVTYDGLDEGKRLIVSCPRPIQTRQFSWKISSSSGLFNLLEFKALLEPGGYPR